MQNNRFSPPCAVCCPANVPPFMTWRAAIPFSVHVGERKARRRGPTCSVRPERHRATSSGSTLPAGGLRFDAGKPNTSLSWRSWDER